MLRKVISLIFFTYFSLSIFAQSLSEKEFLDVYIDCPFCNMNDIRNNISYLNYVRESLLSDVHILVTRVQNASNGYKYSFRFIGRKDFAEMQFIRSFSEPADMILAERQQAIRNQGSCDIRIVIRYFSGVKRKRPLWPQLIGNQ